MKQCLLKNQPGSALRPFAKDYKAHSLQQTSFAESPNRHIVEIDGWSLKKTERIHEYICAVSFECVEEQGTSDLLQAC